MNILHISTPVSWRGGEQQLAYLAEGIRDKAGEQIFVCAEGGAMEVWCMEKGFTVFPILPNILSVYTNASLIRRICRNYRIDFIHTHDSKAHTLAFAAAVLGSKTPMIISRKVDFPVGQSSLSRKKYNHPAISRFICVSEEVKRVLAPAIKDRSKLRVVYDGVETQLASEDKAVDLRSEFSIPEEYAIIGNVSALAPHKDYFTWLRTAEILIGQGHKVKFLIVGDGPLKADIAAFVEQKKLTGHVILAGFRADAKSILAGYDVFFISSETEGLGSSILDAYVRKVPVVATSAGGIPEIVKGGETGLLAPVKDAGALAGCIRDLINDQALRKKLTTQAFAFVQDFDWRKMAHRTWEVYQEALAQQPL